MAFILGSLSTDNLKLMNAIAEISQLKFAWRNQSKLLDIPYHRIEAGERVFISGPSGVGKTTLLGLLGGAFTPQQGEIRVLKQSFKSMKPAARGRFRADHFGFLLPTPNLLPYLSALDNVTVACQLSQRKARLVGNYFAQRETAIKLLIQMGLTDPTLWYLKATELTLFQQQQVMFARALIGQPEIIIADEPVIETSTPEAALLTQSFMQECAEKNISLIYAGQRPVLEDHFDYCVNLNDLCKPKINLHHARAVLHPANGSAIFPVNYLYFFLTTRITTPNQTCSSL